MRHLLAVLSVALLGLGLGVYFAPNVVAGEPIGPGTKPNIIVVYADDISARELPIYGSSVWTRPGRVVDDHETSDPAFLAKTPVMDQMATEGVWIKNAWAATVCGPSRAMMMTGRYAHQHKWWHNKDKGKYVNAKGKKEIWPLYASSPLEMGTVAQQSGYATMWAGKTQMAGDIREFGFDEGLFTPGAGLDGYSPYTDFSILTKKVDGERILINQDTGKPGGLYQVSGYFWQPGATMMNHPDAPGEIVWWPYTEQQKAEYGLTTYAPDVELDYIFDFMERKTAENKPFFVYHTSHLGHAQFDWFHPESNIKYPGTPIIEWDGSRYTRTEPKITGDNGVYDTHGTVTEPGMHSHVEYLDYQMWLYREKLEELGIADNTIVIFTADNGTHGYGKSRWFRQVGPHVPFIIYAPGMTKQGEQDVLVNISDILPTIAELGGFEFPEGYEIDGTSLVPFLFTDQEAHRDWVYAWQREGQILRGELVLIDGAGDWYDVSQTPDDLDDFPKITDWSKVSEAHRAERDELLAILPRFDLHATERNAPNAQ
ncbi:sulfatase-like hydrolase/transferase [Algisphaera agarilytica]|uniref:Arylsulfatase A-like enzyme n=1 Tax=Algisphaera agarilytica TaxID=1385975 RepID=A0A7X0H832_9BACT|nr:sulfatase-like hydrolase/transferase [Algisphaera agarilytica]MBB6429550.1 arylsulfatase A-like enzyme [Algisphaera agarilytica]